MKKVLILLATMLLMLAMPALAQHTDDVQLLIRPYLPENAVYLSREMEDGRLELKYWVEQTQETIEIELDAAAARVLKIKRELRIDRGSKTVSLGEDAVRSLILSVYPEVVIEKIALTKDDGYFEYEAFFRTAEFLAKWALHPETGVILEQEMDFAKAAQLTEASVSGGIAKTQDGLIASSQAEAIALSRAGSGRILSIRLDREDGRQVYEGKVVTDTYEYEFEIDAITGAIRDWDRERLEHYDRDDDDDWDDDD